MKNINLAQFRQNDCETCEMANYQITGTNHHDVVVIVVSYTPNLEDYPGAETIADAMREDINSLKNGEFTFDEFLEGAEVGYHVVDESVIYTWPQEQKK